MGNPAPEKLEEYYKKIFKLSLYYLKNREEAEDIAQDIFLKVHEKISTFRGDSDIYTWIYRIAVNSLKNYLKRKKIVEFISFETKIFGNEEDDPELNAEMEDEKEERINKLERAIELLSSREKTAFYFYYYEELKQKHVAEIMGTTISAVESLIYKAMKKIKKKLA